jgi:hydrogenase-4 component F
VCALLSGIETTSVLYVILRLLPIVAASPAAAAVAWMPIFGLISVGAAAFLLIQVRDYKRLFAFSTVEHMGIILIAAGLGSRAAHYGAMYQVVSHTVTKSFCFFAAGAVVLTVSTREIASVRGLIRTSPAAATSLLLGALAIAGAPPLAVFLSELAILKAAVEEGRYVVVGLLATFIAVAFFGVLLHINRMVFGHVALAPASTDHGRGHDARQRLPVSCVSILIVAGALVVVLGFYLPAPLDVLLRMASGALQR